MGLFVPLLLGGLAFAALPWIIHRIRKPTQNPVPFSSLMFVPETVPPVRKRRKIEHPWLMLLRMLILITLALAFTRPYLVRQVVAESDPGAVRRHVLLVDTSMSLGDDARFATLRAAAVACLDSLAAGDAVAVVAFNDAPEVLAAFADAADPDAGTVGRARAALERLAPSYGGTRLVPALQVAEQLLRPTGEAPRDDDDTERFIHLVSDLQRTALPEENAGYTLGRGISIRLAPVAPLAGGNQAVEAVAVEARRPGTLHVRARLRNYGAEPVEGLLQLRLDGENVTETPVMLLPDSNTTFPLSSDADLSKSAWGEVRLVSEDVLPADNAHYFVFEPAPLRAIGVLLDAGADRAQPIRFLEAAIAESQPLPWRLTPVEAAVLLDADVESVPEVLVIPELAAMPEALGAALAAYVDRGGRLLIIPGTGGVPAALTEALLAPAGVVPEMPWRETIAPDTFALMNWIDFDHPVFTAFRSAAYSDFSMVRFSNFFRLSVAPDADLAVLARLDASGAGGGYPAAIGFDRGDGKVAVWAFPLDPSWTNLTRTRRFIPLLHETIAQLLPALPAPRAHRVGDLAAIPAALADAGAAVQRQLPAETEAGEVDTDATPPRLAAPGFLRWNVGDEAGSGVTEPVNLDSAESDLRVFTAEELLLRLGAVSQDLTQAAAAPTPETGRNVVHWEYGYYVLAALAAAGLLESFLAARYSDLATRERHVT